MDKIETIIDSFGGEHVIVYKSETEWTSYTKAAYDEQQANKDKAGVI